MSETAAAETVAEEQPDPPAQEVDWKAKAREWERRAKSNADAAKRLTQIEDAQKTEAQRTDDEMTSLRTTAGEAQLKLRHYEALERESLPLKFARFLSGTTDEEIAEQVQELRELTTSPPAAPTRPPQEVGRPVATNGTPPVVDPDQWFRDKLRH